MTLKGLTSKYIRNSEKVLAEIKLATDVVVIDEEKIKGIIESAGHYLNDAKHYEEKDKLETSLASVAYCDGLLDALRLLGVVEFTWPNGKREK
jgi:FAD synthetase